MEWWERLAYAVTRGAVRAYLDVLRERDTFEEEKPNEQDKARAIRIGDAIRGTFGLHPPAGANDPKRIDPA
jgi:hypothetical protein